MARGVTVEMLKAASGADFCYRRGEVVTVDAKTAGEWEAAEACLVLEGKPIAPKKAAAE